MVTQNMLRTVKENKSFRKQNLSKSDKIKEIAPYHVRSYVWVTIKYMYHVSQNFLKLSFITLIEERKSSLTNDYRGWSAIIVILQSYIPLNSTFLLFVVILSLK